MKNTTKLLIASIFLISTNVKTANATPPTPDFSDVMEYCKVYRENKTLLSSSNLPLPYGRNPSQQAAFALCNNSNFIDDGSALRNGFRVAIENEAKEHYNTNTVSDQSYCALRTLLYCDNVTWNFTP